MRNRARAESMLSWSSAADRYLSLYAELLARRRDTRVTIAEARCGGALAALAMLARYRARPRSRRLTRSRALAARRLRAMLVEARRAPFHAERMRAAGLTRPSALRDLELPIALQSLPPLSKRELLDAGDAALRDGRVHDVVVLVAFVGIIRRAVPRLVRSARVVDAQVSREGRARVAPQGCAGPIVSRSSMRFPNRMTRAATARARSGACAASACFASRRTSRDSSRAFAPDAHLRAPLGAARGRARDARTRGAPRSARADASSRAASCSLPAARRTIADAFGGTASDVYGTSETKEIAWECAAGSRHINADVVHVEILDERDAPVARGHGGRDRRDAARESRHAARALPHRRPRVAAPHSAALAGGESPLLGVVQRAGGRHARAPRRRERARPTSLTMALESDRGTRAVPDRAARARSPSRARRRAAPAAHESRIARVARFTVRCAKASVGCRSRRRARRPALAGRAGESARRRTRATHPPVAGARSAGSST